MCVCHHPFAALEKWRQCIPQLHVNGWWVMDAFIWPSAEMTECWMVCPNITKEKKLPCAVRVLWKSCMSCSWDKMDLCLTILRQLLQWSMANITAHSCRVRWGRLFAVNNQNGLSTMSGCFRTMQHLIVVMMCKMWCGVGAGRCWHILPLFWILQWLLVVNTCERNICGKQFESVDDMNTAVTASLHHLSKDEYRDAIDHLTHRWEKCVDSAGDYIEWRTYV